MNKTKRLSFLFVLLLTLSGCQSFSDNINPSLEHEELALVGDFSGNSWNESPDKNSKYYISTDTYYYEVSVEIARVTGYDPSLRVVKYGSWETVVGYQHVDLTNSTGVYGEQSSEGNIALAAGGFYDLIIDLSGASPIITLTLTGTSSESSSSSDSSSGSSSGGLGGDDGSWIGPNTKEGEYDLYYDPDEVIFTDYNNTSYQMRDLFYCFSYQETGLFAASGIHNSIAPGTELFVSCKHIPGIDNLKIYANGKELTEELNLDKTRNMYCFSFTMPEEDAKISATGENRLMNLSIASCEYVDSYFYLDSSNIEQSQTLTDMHIGESFYIYSAIKEEYREDYYIENVYLSFQGYSTYLSGLKEDKTKILTLNEDGTCYTSLDSSYYYAGKDATLNIEVKEIEKDYTEPYEGMDFLGYWRGFELQDGYVASSSSYKDMNLTFYEDGSMYSSTQSSFNSKSVVGLDNENNPILSDNRVFYNDGSVAIMFYSLNSAGVGSTRTVFIYAHSESLPTYELYKFDTSCTIFVMRLFIDDEYIGAVYADTNLEPRLYAGVNIVYNDGMDSLSSSSSFDIYSSSGVLLNSVG